MIDRAKIEQAVRLIIEAVGDNPEREGLINTPRRVAGMYAELLDGMNYTNDEIAEMFGLCFVETKVDNKLIVETKIPIFSLCEHHLALMYNMTVSVAYISKGKVIGLSKIARIVDMVSKRLQLQERIGEDIASILKQVLGTEDVIIVIEGEHSCLTARGIKARGTITKTAAIYGQFITNSSLRAETYALIS